MAMPRNPANVRRASQLRRDIVMQIAICRQPAIWNSEGETEAAKSPRRAKLRTLIERYRAFVAVAT